MNKTVFGLAKNEDQARKIIERLQAEHFDTESISFLLLDRENKLTRKSANGRLEANPEYFERPHKKNGMLGHEKHTKAPEGAATGATAGGIIGGSLGLLAGIGALAIPGIGPFVAAGPLMAALGGSAIGGSIGLLVGALAGLGIPEYEAKKLEKGLKDGHLLISVEAHDAKQIERAEKILKEGGATDISSVSNKAGVR